MCDMNIAVGLELGGGYVESLAAGWRTFSSMQNHVYLINLYLGEEADGETHEGFGRQGQ